MIPIGDVNPRRSFPVATVGLILMNVGVFLYQLTLTPEAQDVFIASAALIPQRLLGAPSLGAAITLVTAMFVHSGWLHLIGNMIFLWVFGDNVEDRLGILPFLGIYLLTGLAASAAQVASAPASTIPIVGASGALSGIAGVYLVLFPRARVRVLLPIFVFVRIIEVSALAFFAIWFLLQAVQGLADIGGTGDGGVAWFAHMGGFLAGVVVGLLVRGGSRLVRPPRDEWSPRW
jgi:membrane associated rhomboid family serine protease